ncbi:MAG: hypothetical protein U0869_07025 [Chloroflexota bacterium]
MTGDGATNAANLQQALGLAGVDVTVLKAGEDTNAASSARTPPCRWASPR